VGVPAGATKLVWLLVGEHSRLYPVYIIADPIQIILAAIAQLSGPDAGEMSVISKRHSKAQARMSYDF